MRRRIITIGTGVVVAALLAGGGIAWATGGNGEHSLTGATRAKAIAAALRHTGGGTVTETEAGDDGAAYGVEVRRADGTQVDVSLDKRFNVIADERDDDGGSDDHGSGDD